ncbi:hypothetical protein [Clostridium oryzae]|uniref:Uncharacterized protein n=1 Tax=Clostridium oryzae TaxID=1450648 RepID=A0A1V4IQX0_9CLOT|nr:hypothetical protein [Clostridium oryzae]OPJ62421.1 hypothetical protein CLORY_17900 [Clostridium oryzae]
MFRINGRIIKNNKIVKDLVVEDNLEGSYQDKLKRCIDKICKEIDIARPYWLPVNVHEYNKRRKVIFDYNNFIDDIDFDKFVIEELKEEE